AVSIATPVIGTALGNDEEVRAAARLAGACDRQAQARDMVADPPRRRRRGQIRFRTTEEGADCGAAAVHLPVRRLEHTVGGEQRHQLIEAPAIGAVRVRSHQVANLLAGNQLPGFQWYLRRRCTLAEPAPIFATASRSKVRRAALPRGRTTPAALGH